MRYVTTPGTTKVANVRKPYSTRVTFGLIPSQSATPAITPANTWLVRDRRSERAGPSGPRPSVIAHRVAYGITTGRLARGSVSTPRNPQRMRTGFASHPNFSARPPMTPSITRFDRERQRRGAGRFERSGGPDLRATLRSRGTISFTLPAPAKKAPKPQHR